MYWIPHRSQTIGVASIVGVGVLFVVFWVHFSSGAVLEARNELSWKLTFYELFVADHIFPGAFFSAKSVVL